MEHQKKEKGFTLIELLIVVAIIGLLATIVLVAVTRARKKANATQAKAHITEISKALDMYVANGCPGNVNVSINAGATIATPSGCATDPNDTLITAVPTAASGFTYTTGNVQPGSYTIRATGFTSGTWTCTNGSCYCTVANGCQESN